MKIKNTQPTPFNFFAFLQYGFAAILLFFLAALTVLIIILGLLSSSAKAGGVNSIADQGQEQRSHSVANVDTSTRSYAPATDLGKAVPPVYAPATSTGFNVCSKSITGGASVAGFGASLGIPLADEPCNRRQDAIVMMGSGDVATGREIMCDNVKILKASVRAGKPCWLDDPDLLDELSDAERKAYLSMKNNPPATPPPVSQYRSDLHIKPTQSEEITGTYTVSPEEVYRLRAVERDALLYKTEQGTLEAQRLEAQEMSKREQKRKRKLAKKRQEKRLEQENAKTREREQAFQDKALDQVDHQNELDERGALLDEREKALTERVEQDRQRVVVEQGQAQEAALESSSVASTTAQVPECVPHKVKRWYSNAMDSMGFQNDHLEDCGMEN
jgi:hypothetical protein